jgi:erythromycin esterase
MYNSAQHITADNLDMLLRSFLLEKTDTPEVQKVIEMQSGFVFSESEEINRLSSSEKRLIKKLAEDSGFRLPKGIGRNFLLWIFPVVIIILFVSVLWNFFMITDQTATALQIKRNAIPLVTLNKNIQGSNPLAQPLPTQFVIASTDSSSITKETKTEHHKKNSTYLKSNFPVDDEWVISKNDKKREDNYLNLDFETTYPATYIPEVWWTFNDLYYKADYKASSDSISFFSGKRSITLEYAPVKNSTFHYGSVRNEIPETLLKGRSKVEISAAIKVMDNDWDKAYIYCSAYGKKATAKTNLKYHTVTSTDQKGTISGEWKIFTLEMLLDTSYTGVDFGGYYMGEQSASFDAFEIKIDGEKLEDIKPVYEAPKEKEIVWLNQNCIPLNTPDAGTDNIDLSAVKEMIGEARIVAIDNSSYCSKESFSTIHRFIKFLVQEKGFRLIALYAGMPEVYPLNKYIQTGEGNLNQLLDSLHYWYWNTAEMMDIIDWMKTYNKGRSDKITICGFDYTHKDYATENITAFGQKYDKKIVDLITKLEKVTKKLSDKKLKNAPAFRKNKLDQWETVIEEISSELEINNASLVSKAVTSEMEWVEQNVKLLKQYYEQTYTYAFYSSVRSNYLKDNIKWDMEENPGSKMILLSFGQMMEKDKDWWLGYHLDKEYGDSLYSFVLAGETGEYLAFGDSLLSVNKLSAPYKGTFEYYFEKCDYPDFILDLKKANAADSASAWLMENLFFRNFFGLATLRQFSQLELQKNYDAIINIRNATAADCYRIGKTRQK